VTSTHCNAKIDPKGVSSSTTVESSTLPDSTIRVEILTDPVSRLRLYAAINAYIDWLLEQAAEKRETESAA
jgi:hypothetical protein